MTLKLRAKLKQKPKRKLYVLLVLAGMLWAGAAQADTVAETESDCRIENNEVTCRVLSDVRPAGTTNYPGGRTVRISIPSDWTRWTTDDVTRPYHYPAQRDRRVTVFDDAGQDVSTRCPLTVSLTHWVTEHQTEHNRWAKADTTAWLEARIQNNNSFASQLWWAGELKRSGDIARCPPGELTVRLTFTPVITHQDDGTTAGTFPPVQADFRVLNTKHVRLRVPPTIGLALTDRGAAGSGIILLQRWGDVSMEVTRADNDGEPSLNPPSGSSTAPLPLDVTLDTLSGRRNVAKGSKDNVIGWDRRAGENGYRLNITTKGNVKKQLTDEPGTWRSTLRVTVNAL